MMQYVITFPGQGSQVVGMGRDFYENIKECKLIFEEASDAIKTNIAKLCFEGPLDTLTLTENLQPALFTTEVAILTAVRIHKNPEIKAVAGHSLGEYTALYASGVIDLTTGVKLTRSRGEFMQKAVPAGIGTMAAILGLDDSLVEKACLKASLESGKIVEPANFNSPGQVVISGDKIACDRFSEILKTDPEFKGGKYMPLTVSAPFHCSLMKPALDAMKPLIQDSKLNDSKINVIQNADANIHLNADKIRINLIEQIVKPVRWTQSMAKLKELGIENMLELGPGKVLTGLQKRIDRSVTASSISSIETMKEVLK